MTKPREPKQPKAHTVVQRKNGWTVEYFCTTCGKYLKCNETNKRCKGGQR